jgi:uncharacterized protein
MPSGDRHRGTLVGVLSDTHGLLRPGAVTALKGVDRIVHAGDVGDRTILEALARIAPVTAVRGNVDEGAMADELPGTAVVEVTGVHLYVLHDLAELDLDPREAGFAVVIHGHTHAPALEERGGVLYFNPGSAGPRRFRLPVSLGRLTVERGKVRAELVRLTG